MDDLPKGSAGLILKGPKFIRTTLNLIRNIDEVAQRIEHRQWEGIQTPWSYATTSAVATAALLILFGEKVKVDGSAGGAIIDQAVADPSILIAWAGFSLILQLVVTKALSVPNTVTALYAYLYGLGIAAIAFCLIVLSLKFSSLFGSPPSMFPIALFLVALGPVLIWSFFAVPVIVLARVYKTSNELAFGLLIAYSGVIFYVARGSGA